MSVNTFRRRSTTSHAWPLQYVLQVQSAPLTCSAIKGGVLPTVSQRSASLTLNRRVLSLRMIGNMANTGTKNLWQPLRTEQSFRVLDVMPGHESGIYCKLEEATFDHPPQYEALSYRCDDPSEVNGTLQIVINGVNTSIGPNLYQALRALRLACKPRKLWVDMLCINQQSDEKRKQIMVMHKIYSFAQRVLIWLGEASSNSDLAMESFPELVEYLKARGDNNLDMQNDLDQDNTERHWIFVPDDARVKASQDLLRRSWFYRMWTLQEAALASSRSILQCGNRQFPYSVLIEFFRHKASGAARLWNMAQGQVEVRNADDDITPAFLHTRIVAQLREVQSAKSPDSATIRVLEACRGLKCTEVGDKVWSVARFLPDAFLQHLATIDRLDPSRLFTELALTEVEQGHGENVLAAAGISQQVPNNAGHPLFGLHSWVPDWTWCGSHTGIGRIKQTQQIRYGKILYQASGNSTARMRAFQSSGKHCLQVKGKLLGHITDMIDPYVTPPVFQDLPEGETKDRAQLVSYEIREDYVQKSLKLANSCEPGPYGINTTSACLHTLCASFLTADEPKFAERELTQPTDQEVVQEFEEGLFIFKYSRQVMIFRQGRARDPQTWTQEEFDDWTRAGEFMVENSAHFVSLARRDTNGPTQRIEQMDTMCRNRRFFVTNDLYMGLGPAVAAKGDRVCLFSGCCTPYIVRPLQDGRFILVGECYVHGVMQGELLNVPVEQFFDTDLILV